MRTKRLIVDDGDSRSRSRSRHWNDSAQTLLQGLILFTLVMPKGERNLVAMRQLLTLTHPALLEAFRSSRKRKKNNDCTETTENRTAVETLLLAMADSGDRYDGILASIGRRFLNMPPRLFDPRF